MIVAEGRGVVVLLREAGPTNLSEKARLLTGAARPFGERPDHGTGAQILRDIGLRDIILLSDKHRSFVNLESYGLHVAEERVIEHRP